MAVTEKHSDVPEGIHRAQSADVEDRFRQLAAEWRDAIGPLSSATKIVQHSAYQGIIALGSDVVPLILRDLEQKPDHWFAALRAITGEDPVAPEDRGLDGRNLGPLGEGAWFLVVSTMTAVWVAQ